MQLAGAKEVQSTGANISRVGLGAKKEEEEIHGRRLRGLFNRID